MSVRAVHALWLTGVFLTLAWGAAAFGGNYPWAYWPLLVSSVILGFVGLVVGRRAGAFPRALVVALVILGAAICVQLIPLPASVLANVSSNADRILQQQDLQYALQRPPHPLSIDPSRTLLGLTFFVCFGTLLVGTARGLTRERARTLARGIVVLGAGMATIGVVERATLSEKIYGFWEPLYAGNPFGPFVNRNHFAGWMLMALPVALGFLAATVSHGMRDIRPGIRNRLLWFSSTSGSASLLAGFAVLAMTLSVMLTLSRSGIIGLAVSLCLAALIVARRQTRSQTTIAAAALVVVAVGVLSWAGIDRIASRFGEDGVLLSGRIAIWKSTGQIIRDFWLFGTGLNTYGVSTLHYAPALPGLHVREAHNDYLQILSEGGLLLGVPVVVASVAFAVAVHRQQRHDIGSIWWIRMGAVTGLVAIAAQSMAEFSLQMPGNAVLFAVLAGLALHNSNVA